MPAPAPRPGKPRAPTPAVSRAATVSASAGEPWRRTANSVGPGRPSQSSPRSEAATRRVAASSADAGVGQVAAAVELVLEGLHLTRRIDKQSVNGRTVYGA